MLKRVCSSLQQRGGGVCMTTNSTSLLENSVLLENPRTIFLNVRGAYNTLTDRIPHPFYHLTEWLFVGRDTVSLSSALARLVDNLIGPRRVLVEAWLSPEVFSDMVGVFSPLHPLIAYHLEGDGYMLSGDKELEVSFEQYWLQRRGLFPGGSLKFVYAKEPLPPFGLAGKLQAWVQEAYEDTFLRALQGVGTIELFEEVNSDDA